MPGDDEQQEQQAPSSDGPLADRFFGLSGKPGEAAESEARGDQRRKKWAAAGAGTELAAGIGLFAGLGYLGDRWLGTLPWLTVAGALLGMTAGLYLLIKAVQR